VVIIDSADELNPNAANALLKSLEEPPERAVFVLISSEPSRLLPTIRSRCRRLDLQPLASEPLEQAARAALAASDVAAPQADQWDEIVRLAAGSVRRALQLAAGGLEMHGRVEGIMSNLPKVDWAAIHTLSDGLGAGANQQRYEAFFELLLDKVARLARARATGDGDASEVSLAKRVIAQDRLLQWAGVWEAVLRDKAAVEELNLDRKALIVRSLARLADAAKG
jgi:DNA polymerase-3 subunit delta'